MIFCEGLLKNNITQTPVGATRLRIVSGFATPGVAEKHLSQCPGLKIDVLVGMTGTGGIPLIHHKGFLALENAHSDFTCSYSKQKNIHSKLYLWEDGTGKPLYALMGSANYTTQALLSNQQEEILCECDPQGAQNYINRIWTSSNIVRCSAPDVETHITLNSYIPPTKPTRTNKSLVALQNAVTKLPYVELSLLRRDGKMYAGGGGINWGCRSERSDSNEAYIAVPAKVRDTGFFPAHGHVFNVLANKTQWMQMSVVQGGSKGLQTTDNSVLGLFLRQCLGLKSGCLVRLKDLKGRTTVRFYKVDDENFYMEF